MNLVRNEHDEISDRLLLMHLISKARKLQLGIPKIEKLAFLIEALTHKKRIKTFNYNFLQTESYGPQSIELYQDYERLVTNHLVTPVIPKLTKRGGDILKQSYEVFETNREVTDEIDKIIDEYDGMTLDQLQKFIGHSEIIQPDKTMSIKDIPAGYEVFNALPDSEAKAKFKIDDSWLETFEILLDEEYNKSLDKALKNAKKGRLYSYDEIFGDA